MSTAKLEACWKCALVSTLILVATVATLLIVLRLSHDPRIVAGLAATASLLLCLTSAHVLMFILRSKAAKREIAENPRLAVSPKQPCCGQGAVNGPTTPNISPLTTSLPNARSTDATQQKLQTEAYRARVFSHDRGDFRSIRHSNVLIYWPHGFGDWVQLAYILPLFEPSNRYWITRFGDDNTSVMDCHDIVIPVYLGLNSTHCGDGQAFGIRHFGLLYDEIDGGERELRLPRSLYDVCATNHIDVIFWSGFPETAGFTLHPYHSKARNLLSHLVEPCRLSTQIGRASCRERV